MDDTRKRNIERRRETSRYAARDRRGKEADIFSDLKDVVPIVEEGTVTHLDRIALLRVAATVCRLRKTAGNVLESKLCLEENTSVWTEDSISECLDGFVIIADSDTTILYVTESVSIYVGLTQTDLTGRTLKDFLHPSDYDEFVRISGELHKSNNTDTAEGLNVVFRMKTVISPRGRCLNLKSALYKPVSFLINSKASSGGYVLLMQGVTIPAGQGSINANASALTKYTDAPNGAFMTRHTCDMKISFVSDRFNYILRSELKSLMGTSFYDLVHPADVTILSRSMKELFNKGHIRTPYYRLVAANNTLAWVQTEATTISHTTKGQKGMYIICVHFVLGIQGEEESLIMCTDAVPAGMQVNIKKEIDDTRDYIGRQPEIVDCVEFTPLIGSEERFDVETLRPIPEPTIPAKSDMGARKSSFDDVLQWLFRDQPSSPPPARHRREEAAITRDPTLASANFMDPSVGAYQQAGMRETIGCEQWSSECPNTNYSAIDERIAQFDISSPPSLKSTTKTNRDGGYVVGGGDSTNSARCFSAIPSSDGVDVPSSGLGGQVHAADMFPIVPIASGDVAATQEDSPSMNNCEPIICDNLKWEEPDLSGLAPFVDTGDMLQIDDALPPEIQALYNLPDFTPAEPSIPAARPVMDNMYSEKKEKQAPVYDPYLNPYSQYRQDAYWNNQNVQHHHQQQHQSHQPPADPTFPSFSLLS